MTSALFIPIMLRNGWIKPFWYVLLHPLYLTRLTSKRCFCFGMVMVWYFDSNYYFHAYTNILVAIYGLGLKCVEKKQLNLLLNDKNQNPSTTGGCSKPVGPVLTSLLVCADSFKRALLKMFNIYLITIGHFCITFSIENIGMMNYLTKDHESKSKHCFIAFSRFSRMEFTTSLQ